MKQLLKRTTIYLKPEVREMLDNVSFLTKETKVDLVNDSILIHLKNVIKEKKLEKKIEDLQKLKSKE